MPSNTFKHALAQQRTQLGLFLGLANPSSTELLAGSGYDFLMLDAEHGPNDVRSIQAQLQAAAPYPVQCLVRPPNHDPALIKQLLGVGAQTLLVPMVDSALQARALVSAMRYPPLGIRGVGTAMERASCWNGAANYFELADANTCLLVQVESQAALDNIEAVANVDGVDGMFLGPSDLAASLGYLGQPSHPAVRTSIEQAIARITGAGKAAGVFCSDPALAEVYRAHGARFIALGTDAGLLRTAASTLLNQARSYSTCAEDTRP